MVKCIYIKRMSYILKYNVKSEESDRMLQGLFNLCKNIQKGIHRKEFKIYESLLSKLYKSAQMYCEASHNEYKEWEKEDSDNESLYDESIRNEDSDNCDVASVSSYNSECDDEDMEEELKMRKDFQNYDIECNKKFEQITSMYPYPIDID